MGERLHKENKMTRRESKRGETRTDQMKTTKVNCESIVPQNSPRNYCTNLKQSKQKCLVAG